MKNKKPLVIIAIVAAVLLMCCGCSMGSYYLFSGDEIISESSDDDLIGETCDDIVDNFQAVYRNEKMTIIKNPCDVIWLLAQEEESYTLQTNEGTTIYVTVWRNWENNTTPGTTFSIRGLDVEDSDLGVENNRENSGILITRWVPNEESLEEAKTEFDTTVRELNY